MDAATYVNVSSLATASSWRSAHFSSSLGSSVYWQNGQTPLMLAAEQGSLEILQELIRRGANVNLDDVVSLGTNQSPCFFCSLDLFLWRLWLLVSSQADDVFLW